MDCYIAYLDISAPFWNTSFVVKYKYLTQQISYWSDFLHSLDTGEKNGATMRQYSQRVWGTHEISHVH
jgi:hypothetical protein